MSRADVSLVMIVTDAMSAWFAPARDELLRAALDAAVDGHTLWAPVFGDGGQIVDLTCVYMNRASEAIIGQTGVDIVGSSLLAGSAALDNGEFSHALLQVALTGIPIRRRLRLKTRSGGEAWVDLSAVQLAGGVSVSGRDVTGEVALRAKLEAAVRVLATQATTDPLTGLANRRAWSEALADHLLHAPTQRLPLVIALLDLDRFKDYNDRCGHLAGDALLVQAAARWQAALPSAATLARLGGEEFAVALPNMAPTAARELLIHLCTLVPADQTSSAGLTIWDGSEDEASLLGRADAALYAAKHAGRNRVEALLPLL